jgi:hypothetical protein
MIPVGGNEERDKCVLIHVLQLSKIQFIINAAVLPHENIPGSRAKTKYNGQSLPKLISLINRS